MQCSQHCPSFPITGDFTADRSWQSGAVCPWLVQSWGSGFGHFQLLQLLLLTDGLSLQDNYTFAQPGIQKKVKALEELVSRIDGR